MMTEKVNLRIEDFEDKKGQTSGKRFTRFKTSAGWMSAFDKETIEPLKDAEGKVVIVDVAESTSGDRVFYNIRKFHGLAPEGTQPGEIAKATAPIAEEAEEKIPVVKPGETVRERMASKIPASMLISYAKDLIAVGWDYKKAVQVIKDLQADFE